MRTLMREERGLFASPIPEFVLRGRGILHCAIESGSGNLNCVRFLWHALRCSNIVSNSPVLSYRNRHAWHSRSLTIGSPICWTAWRIGWRTKQRRSTPGRAIRWRVSKRRSGPTVQRDRKDCSQRKWRRSLLYSRSVENVTMSLDKDIGSVESFGGLRSAAGDT